MQIKRIAAILVLPLLMTACKSTQPDFDASGSFEADEVIVSAELPGKILSFNVEEGSKLAQGSVVGKIDAENISLQQQQVEASIAALREKTADVNPQVQLLRDQLAVQQAQIKNLLHEKQRTQNLIKADAATGKQLDDINAQIDVLTKQLAVTQQQINVQRSNVATQNRAVMSETDPLKKRVAQLNDQAGKSNIVNPVNGTVLTKYAAQGEVTAPGKALYKIADLSYVYLRAYITGNQLAQVKLGQQVKVLTDDGSGGYKNYKGTVSWISDKAEFTPKTIQTKEERANLVYAMKVRVQNDGFLKIGMYGEMNFE